MFKKISYPFVLFLIVLMYRHGFSDVIITQSGEEVKGKIISIAERVVRYIPELSTSQKPETIALESVCMVKYDNGIKMVTEFQELIKTRQSEDDDRMYSAYVFCETGLFGLVNINEERFEPGVFTVGVTPSIDRRINRFLSIGAEYMILWAKTKSADDSRFLMNCNGLARLSFSLHPKCNFLAQLNAGLSIWPGAESVHATDTTFFKDRIGWDIHGGLGLEYKTTKSGSLVLFAGYNANFSTRENVPITIDMLLLSIGPRIRF